MAFALKLNNMTTLKKTELKEYIGKFGQIAGGEKGFKKSLPGKIIDVDVIGAVYFKDNDGYGYFFPPNKIDTFEELEFKPKT
jgi:hypothetical protein